MNADEIATIRQRAEQATPGPWKWKYSGWCGPDSLFSPDETVINLACSDCRGDGPVIEQEADSDFIAHAREDVPALLDALDEARAALAAAERERDELRAALSELVWATNGVDVTVCDYCGVPTDEPGKDPTCPCAPLRATLLGRPAGEQPT